MTTSTLRIATRKSPLALWQANWVKTALEKQHPQLEVTLHTMTTRGDRFLETPLTEIGGKALFTKELENSILAGETDIAVHSMKDIPVELPEGLEIAIYAERHDPNDAFIANDYNNIMQLPEGAIVGTTSLRRQSQLLALRPDISVKPLRGNVQTRLQKLDEGQYHGIILACAGLERLQLHARISQRFNHEEMLPAAGQGIIGIECRKHDEHIKNLIQCLTHQETTYCIEAERAVNQTLNGSCHTPLAAHAFMQQHTLYLHGLVGSACGKTIYRAAAQGSPQEALQLGCQVAEQLLEQGANKFLQENPHD